MSSRAGTNHKGVGGGQLRVGPSIYQTRCNIYACRYEITKVLGAGSFGVVREAVDRDTGCQYACKTVPKMPKRGKPTPRYLLKLQQEVDAMQQLGGSFDAVYLRVRNILASFTFCSVSMEIWVSSVGLCSARQCLMRQS